MQERGARRTGLDGRIWLSDRGINQAINEGLIKGIESYPEEGFYDGPINPASINVAAAESVSIAPAEVKVVRHSSLGIDSRFIAVGDVRSRVRRNGLRTGDYSPHHRAFRIANLSVDAQHFVEGDEFCHLFIGSEPEGVAAEFDHGRAITDEGELKRLMGDGHIGVKEGPGLAVEDGFLVFTASGYIDVQGEVESVNGSARKAIERAQLVTLRRLEDGGEVLPLNQAFKVPFAEQLRLSNQVAVQLYNRDLETGSIGLGGIVDPSYEGPLDYHPIVEGSRLLRKGAPVSLGRVIYFEKPVEIPYASERRDSSFQNGQPTEIIAEKPRTEFLWQQQ